MVKESHYNYRFEGLNGTRYICNGLSGCIIREPAHPLTSDAHSDAVRQFLQEHNFLYADDLDEKQALIARIDQVHKTEKSLELTLMLHENCNFRCTYCFQDFRNAKMEGETIDHLARFIEHRLPKSAPLSVHFYGGEPLLAWDSVNTISHKLQEITKERNSPLTQYMTSNGSLLTAERAKRLDELGFSHLKITLDGPPAIHDARRMQINGKPTFDKVINNICAAIAYIPIIIRVNIDGNNIDHLPQLLEQLDQSVINKASLSLDFNIVYAPGKGLAHDLPYQSVYNLQLDALRRGYKLRLPPLARSRNCKFNSPNSYLIDTSGKTYLCEKSDATNVSHINKNQDQTVPPELQRLFRSIADQCAECHLLPLCGGGCRALANIKGTPACPPWKPHLEKYLAVHEASVA